MGYVIGAVLAMVVWGFARASGFGRDRTFYPTVLVVVASYYVLFAVMGGSPRAVVLESIVMAAFVLVAVAGTRVGLWVVAGALAAHGVFDAVHAGIIDNPGVPPWWPAFCMAFDVVAGVVLGAALCNPASNGAESWGRPGPYEISTRNGTGGLGGVHQRPPSRA